MRVASQTSSKIGSHSYRKSKQARRLHGLPRSRQACVMPLRLRERSPAGVGRTGVVRAPRGGHGSLHLRSLLGGDVAEGLLVQAQLLGLLLLLVHGLLLDIAWMGTQPPSGDGVFKLTVL